MTDLFASLAIHLSRHPLVIMLALALVVRVGARQTSLVASAYAITAGAALLVYAAVAVSYALTPQYFDAAEPTMTAVGWLFNVGLPIYHEVDSAERYSHIYGPMVFITQGVALDLFGATIQTSKWVGCSVALAALALTFAATRPETTARRALVLTGLCALLFLGFRNYSFWTRAEPLQIFCVAAALACALWRRRIPAAVLFGLAVGVLWNLKITGPAYSLPLFVVLVSRAGWGPAALAAGIAAATAAFPFVAFANVSLEAYLTWMRLSAQTGLLLATLRQNIEWAVYFAVPLLLARYATRGAERAGSEWVVTTGAVVVAACGVIVAGSKPGAGPYHLLPLLPIVAWLTAARIGTSELLPAAGVQRIAAAFLAVAVSVGTAQQVQFLDTMAGRRSLDASGDIERFAATHAGVIEMGYAVNDPVTFQRPLLVFRNNAYFLDQPAVGEHLLAGLDTPAATVEAVRQCRVDYWLVPKGEEPFSGVNLYPAVRLKPLFSTAFRQAFFERYAKTESTGFFDVWQCRTR